MDVEWHTSLSNIPNDNFPTLVVAHEFLDALPIHQVRGWGTVWWFAAVACSCSAAACGPISHPSTHTLTPPPPLFQTVTSLPAV